MNALRTNKVEFRNSAAFGFTSCPSSRAMRVGMVLLEITDLWHDIWTRSVSFRSIHSPTLEKKIYDPSLSRREERALCRLRIGHTRLTESYRMENRTARDKCSECDVGADLSVQHIMTECDRYRYLRERFLPGDTLEEIFSHPDRTIVEFLRESDLLKRL